MKRMEAEKLSSTCNTGRPQLSEAKIHCTHKERHISEPPGQTFSNQNMTKKNTLILAWKPLHLQFPTLLAAPYTKPVIRRNQWKQHTHKTHKPQRMPHLYKEQTESVSATCNTYIYFLEFLFIFILDRFYLHYKFTVVKLIGLRIPHTMTILVFPCTFIKYKPHTITFQTEITVKLINHDTNW